MKTEKDIRVMGVHPDSTAADLISVGLVLAGPIGWLGLFLLNGATKREYDKLSH